jgi:hypothetical protein
MENESAMINPAVRELIYGKKTLKKLTIYPLSIGDQFKVTNMVTEIVSTLAEKGSSGTNDVAFMTAVMMALENNLGKILSLIADITEEESAEVISNLTNTQLLNLVESVWLTDYEPCLKKGKDLYERGRSVFSSSGSLPGSSESTPSTDLKTSTEKPSDKVE